MRLLFLTFLAFTPAAHAAVILSCESSDFAHEGSTLLIRETGGAYTYYMDGIIHPYHFAFPSYQGAGRVQRVDGDQSYSSQDVSIQPLDRGYEFIDHRQRDLRFTLEKCTSYPAPVENQAPN